MLTSPYMPEAAIMCRWLFRDDPVGVVQPEPRDGMGAIPTTRWTLDVGGSGGAGDGGADAILPPLFLDGDNHLE